MQPTPSAASSHPNPIPTSCSSAHWEHWEPAVRARGARRSFPTRNTKSAPIRAFPLRENTERFGISQNRENFGSSTMVADPILGGFTFGFFFLYLFSPMNCAVLGGEKGENPHKNDPRFSHLQCFPNKSPG